MPVPDSPTLDAALRLGLAFVLALPLGWEQERRRTHSAGLRTYPLLSLCVCGFLLLALRIGEDAGDQADVFFGVLTGISFVCSGAVMKNPRRVEGMSSLASLWVTGAIGAGVAFGAPLVSVAVSLLCAAALWPGRRASREEKRTS